MFFWKRAKPCTEKVLNWIVTKFYSCKNSPAVHHNIQYIGDTKTSQDCETALIILDSHDNHGDNQEGQGVSHVVGHGVGHGS